MTTVSDGNYKKTETTTFASYEAAKVAYVTLTSKLGCRKPNQAIDDPDSDQRARIRLRADGTFDLVTYTWEAKS